MKPIRFEHIPEIGLKLEEEFSTQKLSELLEEPAREMMYTAREPALFKFQVEREGLEARVTADAQLALSHECVRCLKPIDVDFELHMTEEFEKPELLDLEEIAREELFLELPTYPACPKPCL